MTEIIRVVVYEEDGLWVGQCLEYDVMATAATVRQLRDEVVRALRSTKAIEEAQGRHGFESVPKAPQHFFDMFERAETELASAGSGPATLPLLPFMRLYEREAA